jgi:prepilin-type N-terminal cleavage/methylation domain-containing protein
MTLRLKHSYQTGFTLLEVIVAVVIAALCLSALSQVFATGVRSASATSDYMRAMTLAQGLLAGAGIEKPLTDGSESGVSSDGRLQWSLTVAAEPVEEGDALIKPPLELKRLVARVTVSNPGELPGTKQRNVELTTLLAIPRQTL